MSWSDFRSTRERRLEAELPSFRLHLDSAIRVRQAGEWSQSATAALDLACAALRQDRFPEALIAFDRGQREEIASLSPEEINLRSVSLIHQAESLNNIARNTIKEILQNKTHSISAIELATAAKLRDEDIQNTIFAGERLSRHLFRLSIINFAVLVGVVILGICHVWFPSVTILFPSITTLLGVMCFGALGAAVSMMMSIAPLAGSIPRQLATGTLLFSRPLFGASAALAVYVFIQMGIFSHPRDNDFVYFGLAFVAGFSDQLLLSAVSKIATSPH